MGRHTHGQHRMRGSHTIAFLSAAACLVLSAAPVFAQTTTAATTAPSNQLCFVFTVDGAAAASKELRASCGGHGLILGRTAGYRVVTNSNLNAVVIDNDLGSDHRIILISIRPDGQPMTENISGDLALAAGRGATSDLRGLAVDLDGFGSTGRIAVGPGSGDTANDQSGQIDVGAQLAAETVRQEEAGLQR